MRQSIEGGITMLDLSKDIHSLTDFKRKTGTLVKRLRKTGHPLVLTVNGRAELVVQDARSYQKLLDWMERIETIAGVRRGLEEMEAGKGRPAKEVLEEVRRKYKIPRDR
jgi:prevent-host-death family protein